ncbi:GNAT family N-acetyltransferase [Dongia rigui]|uniref:GNAT family N-acetyltransferase n=1 Tax=Dongia rigui TaxID=940149 RepID=A0ABU5E405_9PROT|nr:GNAT family N-acetyltransferase [Dongia rigui]MDY0874027.1 GNAT family N-acetyltransferase [Dongia rigui]
MSLRPLSRLSPAEREVVGKMLKGDPVLSLYWAAGMEDLARGIDNRLVHLAQEEGGIILGATFGDLSVFSFCGRLADADIAHCIALPGAVELHAPEADTVRYATIAGRRLKQSRGMLLMASPTTHLDEFPVDCLDLHAAHARDVAAFYRSHYPETVFDDYMLSMPFVGGFASDQLVACAGTIAVSRELRSALVGHFATAPDFRGQGFAARLGGLLLDRLGRHGFDLAYLATTTENAAAIRTYEKLGFVPIERLVQLDLMP